MSIAKALGDVLGPTVGVAVRPIAEPQALWSQEEPAMARARPPRVAEFSTGRSCARSAMAELGLPAAPIPMGADRAPIWPPGIVGSISHGGGLCVSIVAQEGQFAGLGVDVEPDDAMPENVAQFVTTDGDVPVEPENQRVIFSIKEAVYKAFYPITGQVWAFDAVQVRRVGPRFEAIVARPVPGWAANPTVTGHVIRRDGIIVTALALSPAK